MKLSDFLTPGPYLSPVKDHGREPSLYRIIVHYYTSHDIPQDKAMEMANRYMRAKLKETK